MSYGIQFKNQNGERVLDENNEVMVVSEKGTVSGVRSTVFGVGDSVNDDFNGKWIRRTHDGTASGRTLGYFTTIVLATTYAQKPSIALRGVNGSPTTLPLSRVYKHNSTSFTSIRMTARQPVSVEWILTTPASAAVTSAIAIPSSDEYGMKVLDDSATQKVMFDSRWPNLYAVRDVIEFPEFTGSNYLTNGIPTSTATIKDCPSAFFSLDGLYGHHSVTEQIEQEAEFGAGLLLLHGGEFYPTIRQTSDTTISMTMVNTEEGVNQSTTAGGDVDIVQPTGGISYVIRYLNF